MTFEDFLLDRWLQDHAGPDILHNFGGSTGPQWRVRDLLTLDGDAALERLQELSLAYSRTAGDQALRSSLAEMAGVPVDHVVVLTGASEALFHVFFHAAEPGANVVVPFPCYPPQAALPRAFGLEVRTYRLRRENAFRVDVDEVAALIDRRTRMLLVNVPHNPTGAVLSDDDLVSLHDLAVDMGVQFVCDEVHRPVFHGQATISGASLPHATTIGDFSKALSIPGVRLGWVIEPDPARRGQYCNAREYVTVCNSPLTELVADVAVRHRSAVFTRAQQVAGDNLAVLDGVFARAADVLGWVRPEGGMTAFPWLLSGENARDFCRAAVDGGILLVPGDCMGMPDHFRLGFGFQSAGFDVSASALETFIRAWR